MKKAFILCVLLAFFLAGCGGQEEVQMEQAKGEAEEVTVEVLMVALEVIPV